MLKVSIAALSAAAVSLGILLGGCQTAPVGQPVKAASSAYWQQMQDKLKQVKVLKAQGRLGLQSPDGRFSANFSLSFDHDQHQLRLSSPFGQELALLSYDRNGAMLRADHKVYRAADPETLFKSYFGQDLPLSRLKDLMLGINPDLALYDQQGFLTSAGIDGFNVKYDSFREVNHLALPMNISITRDNLLLKLKINAVDEVR